MRLDTKDISKTICFLRCAISSGISEEDKYDNNLSCRCDICLCYHWKYCGIHKKSNIIARCIIHNIFDKNTSITPTVINKLTNLVRPVRGVKITNESYIKKIKEEYDLIVERLYRKRK